MITQVDNSKSVDEADLEHRVKAMYKKVAEEPNATYHFEMGRSLAESLGYDPTILGAIPSQSIESECNI